MKTTMQTEIHEFRLDDPHSCESFIAKTLMIFLDGRVPKGYVITPEETHIAAREMAALLIEEGHEISESFFAAAVISHGLFEGNVVTLGEAYVIAKQIAACIVENDA